MVVICILKTLHWNLGLSTDRIEYSDKITNFRCFNLKTVHVPFIFFIFFTSQRFTSSPTYFYQKDVWVFPRKLISQRHSIVFLQQIYFPYVLIFFFFFLLFISYSSPPWFQTLRHKPSIRHCCAMPHAVILWVTSLRTTRTCSELITVYINP
jgi:hypothetical protein